MSTPPVTRNSDATLEQAWTGPGSHPAHRAAWALYQAGPALDGPAWCASCEAVHDADNTGEPCHPDYDPTDAELALAGLIVGAR